MAGGENPGTGLTGKYMGPMSGRRHCAFQSHRVIGENLPFVVRGRYGAMVHGGKKSWQVVAEDCLIDGWFHSDVHRAKVETAGYGIQTRTSRKRAKRSRDARGRGRDWGAAVLIPLSKKVEVNGRSSGRR